MNSRWRSFGCRGKGNGEAFKMFHRDVLVSVIFDEEQRQLEKAERMGVYLKE